MPLETPVVPAVASAAPVVPAVVPAASSAAAAPAEDPNVFFNILREVVSDEPPAPVPVAAAPVVPVVPATLAPVVKKKVTVREPAPQPTVEEIVQKTLRAQTAAPAAPAPIVAPAAAPVVEALVIPDGLNEEEIEEIRIAEYAEKKDPNRKGLAKQFLDFHVANRKFLDEAVAKNDEFDPTRDPEYKKFLLKNEPKVSTTEKRKLSMQREIDAAEERAYERVKKELVPELEATKTRLHEISTRPDVVRKVAEVEAGIFKGVEGDAFKAFAEKGVAAAEDFPVEVEILQNQKQHTVQMSEEFLALRNNLKAFSPSDAIHAEISRFVTEQGDAFMKHGGKHLIRDGKPFVHPSQWKPGMATTHWTFSNDDILGALQVDATRKAQSRIKVEHTRIEKAVAAQTKRSASAPSGAATTSKDEPSPRAAAVAPSGGAPVPVDTAFSILRG